MKDCLICVDIQNDFMPTGSLPVNDGDKIIPIVNDLLSRFKFVVFTQDWHPANHKSFASQHEGKNVFESIELNGLQQTLWPDHCIQNTYGAQIHKDIKFDNIHGNFYIFKKGIDKDVDSYSGFYDNGRKNSTELAEFLNENKIDRVFICGLAGDYCCKYTAIDSAMEGFKTIFILDGTKSISNDLTETLKELKDSNVDIIESWELPLYLLTN